MKFICLIFFVFTCIFALTPLEHDEILLVGEGKIYNGRFILDFNINNLKNGLYLNLDGLSNFSVLLNGTKVCDCKNEQKKSIDLTGQKHLLSNINRLEILSLDEGTPFFYMLWQSFYQWYYGTFHIHTTYSDGVYSVSEILNMVNNEGGNFCAITDHSTLAQCYDTAFHRTGNCEPIRGTEWTTDSGHANILGPEGASAFTEDIPVMQMIDDATYRGGLVQINHPCDDELGMGWDHYPNLDPGIDVIEIFNGRTWFPDNKPKSDPEAVAWWHSLLTQRKRIAAAGNSDYHGNIPGEGGPLVAHSAVYAVSDHPDTILKALKLGKVMICDAMADSRLYIYADTNNNNIMDLVMGENISITSGNKTIKFRLEVDDADVMDEVIVYAREGEIFSRTLYTGGDYVYEWTRTFTNTDWNFMRVELLAWNGDYEYCTNPIYINYPEYEMGPCSLDVSPLFLPETIFVNQAETLNFYLGNDGFVSPYRFGLLVAVETLNFDITAWQTQGPGIGEVIHTPNLSGYEIIEWKGGYPYSVRLSPNNSFNYWLSILPKRIGWQKIFYRSWADDRLFIIDKEPGTGFLGPDNEKWKLDSIYVATQTQINEGTIIKTLHFLLHPNPVNDRLIVNLSTNKIDAPISIKIYDVKGALVKDFIYRKNVVVLNTKDLECGVYFIVGEIDQHYFKRKFVVLH